MTPLKSTESDIAAADNILIGYARFATFDEHDKVREAIIKIIATAMQPEREALSKAKKSIEGLTRLVEELKFAHPHISIGNSVTIGAYLGEAKSALAAIEKVSG